MLRITYPAALLSVAVLAMVPTLVAMAFFDGPSSLFLAPFNTKIALFASLAVGVVLLTIALRASRTGEKDLVQFVIRKVRERPALVLAPILLIFLTAFPSSAFSFVKNAIPLYVPFYTDPAFLTADKWLFLGTDPWRVSHALLGPYGTLFLDKIYIAWFGLIPLLAVWIVASEDRNLQLRGLLTIFFIWIVLGNYAAMLLSSCGPVFYEEFYGSDHYAPLMAELYRANEIAPLAMIPIAEWLLEMRLSGGFGTGISAMPSVHVAIAFFAYLVISDTYPKRWAKAVFGIFAVLIWIGSFHLAWHYAWDGIVSAIAVWAFWRLLGFVGIKPSEAKVEALTAHQQA